MKTLKYNFETLRLNLNINYSIKLTTIIKTIFIVAVLSWITYNILTVGIEI